MGRLHKWMAVSVGVFLVGWLVSGVLMIMPPLGPRLGPEPKPKPLDFEEIRLTPAEAAAALAGAPVETAPLRSLTLKRVAGTAVYEITPLRGPSRMIEARTGLPFELTPAMAEQITRQRIGPKARVAAAELVTSYGYGYQWGPLPVYRIVFEDAPSEIYFVSVRDGSVRASASADRVRGVIESFHTFQPLKLITRRDVVRKGALAALAAVAAAVAATGYWLALLRRSR